MTDPIDTRSTAKERLQCEADPLLQELDGFMTSLLDPVIPSAELRVRLEAEIAVPPLRYAPFFDRTGELFDLPEAAVVAEFARLAEPRVWRFAGLPGVSNVVVHGGPRVAGAEVLFVRFAPGLRFPRHRHTGVERVLVLGGSYTDTEGVVHRPGELREWVAGTAHGFRVHPSEPCTIASVVFSREFEALPLRLLARLLGR